MKVTAQKTPPVPAKLESVNINLAPRLAFVLMSMIGGMNTGDTMKFSNYAGYSEQPPFDMLYADIIGKVTVTDAKNLEKIYSALKEIFESKA